VKVRKSTRTYGLREASPRPLGPDVRRVPIGPSSGRTDRTTSLVRRTLAGPSGLTAATRGRMSADRLCVTRSSAAQPTAASAGGPPHRCPVARGRGSCRGGDPHAAHGARRRSTQLIHPRSVDGPLTSAPDGRPDQPQRSDLRSCDPMGLADHTPPSRSLKPPPHRRGRGPDRGGRGVRGCSTQFAGGVVARVVATGSRPARRSSPLNAARGVLGRSACDQSVTGGPRRIRSQRIKGRRVTAGHTRRALNAARAGAPGASRLLVSGSVETDDVELRGALGDAGSSSRLRASGCSFGVGGNRRVDQTPPMSLRAAGRYLAPCSPQPFSDALVVCPFCSLCVFVCLVERLGR
jgi:hypothetical protein